MENKSTRWGSCRVQDGTRRPGEGLRAWGWGYQGHVPPLGGPFLELADKLKALSVRVGLEVRRKLLPRREVLGGWKGALGDFGVWGGGGDTAPFPGIPLLQSPGLCCGSLSLLSLRRAATQWLCSVTELACVFEVPLPGLQAGCTPP